MGWNPWTPHGVRGVHQESRWNPGGNRQTFGWAPCQINSTWTPGGLHESTWIPGGMTRNLWGSVKSSHLAAMFSIAYFVSFKHLSHCPNMDINHPELIVSDPNTRLRIGEFLVIYTSWASNLKKGDPSSGLSQYLIF